MKRTLNESQLREIVKRVIKESLNEISPELAGYAALKRMQQGKTSQGWKDWQTAVDKFNSENGVDKNSPVSVDPNWGEDFGTKHPKELSANILNYPGDTNNAHYFSMNKDGSINHTSQLHQYGKPEEKFGNNAPVYGKNNYDYSREGNVRKANDMSQKMNNAVSNYNINNDRKKKK